MMKNNQNKDQIRLLTNQLVKNATYLGLSESTIQNMFQPAFESKAGLTIKVNEPGDGDMGNKCKYYTQMPHHPLPNCVHYESKTSAFDILGAIFGKLKRLDKGERTIWNGRNVKANDYVAYVMNQLGHYRDRGQNKYYWRHALRLMTQPAFQLMAFNYVCQNWHRELSMKEVNQIFREVKKLAFGLKMEIKMRRVYIEKANGKWRPLGVPTKAWRVYLHMLNVLIVWFRTGTDVNQHAYKPRSGVHTAWLSLMDKIDGPHIYEFDLESFFPSVSLQGLKGILIKELGFPEVVAGYLIDLNRSLTKLEKEDKLPEGNDRHVLLNTSGNPNPNLPSDIKKLIKDLLDTQTETMLSSFLACTELKSALPSGWSVFKETGVPQGSAISCGLATVSLHYIWKSLGDELLMYADDGLVFPRDGRNVIVEDLDQGIKQNLAKSGWVKRDGEWLKPLKFLGLEIIPPTDSDPARIRAKTRSGSTKEFTLDKMFLIHLLNERDLMMWATSSVPEDLDLDLSEDSQTVFIRDAKGEVLLRELTYSGILKKVKSGSLSLFEVKNKHLKSILNDLAANVKLTEWLTNASQRFSLLKNPLKLLFEHHGLSELSSLFDKEDISPAQAYTDSKLTCSKWSWCYWKLGEHLHRQLENFTGSRELQDWVNNGQLLGDNKVKEMKEWGYSNWSILTNSKRYRAVWDSNFVFAEKANVLKEEVQGEIWSIIKGEMKSWLRMLNLNVYNASTYAVEYLLENDLAIPATFSEIRFSKWNKVYTETLSDENQLKKSRKASKDREVEFKRQFGKWSRNLIIKPKDWMPSTEL